MEHEAICQRPDHRLAAELKEHQVDIFVSAVIVMAEPGETHFFWRPQLVRDFGVCRAVLG
jgi:hypothetical protein